MVVGFQTVYYLCCASLPSSHPDWLQSPLVQPLESSPQGFTQNATTDQSRTTQHHPIHQENETHAIPRILLFTHYRDLLAESDALTDSEEVVLAANVRNSIAHHGPSYQVRFLTDDKCIESLQRVYPSLIPYFHKESQGMFKADMCRGSALYETGGMYLDVDVGVRKNLWLDLLPSTEFVTSRVHVKSNYPGHFFQAILGTAPQSPILFEYLRLFEWHYTGKERVKKGPLGVILLRRAWDRVYNTTSQQPATELYQEAQYHKQLFPDLYPVPSWGVRRACHFVVVAVANNDSHADTEWKGKKLSIPLYSRIGGSRICPINSNTTKT